MILRRVIEHVKAQNWTAVGLDFIIVVTGVFIGIQVANWNAAQADRARAFGYLERIRDDLEADLAGYKERIRFWSEVSDYGIKGLAFADGADPAVKSDWPMLLAFFQASQVGEFFTTDTTYEELKSAGELGLLGDPELRDRLAYYYVNSGNPAMIERPPYREHVRSIIPIAVQLYIWDHCYASDASGRQLLLDCPSPIEDARVEEILEQISGNDALMGELRYWVSSMRVAQLIADNQIENAEILRASVKTRLDQRNPGGAP